MYTPILPEKGMCLLVRVYAQISHSILCFVPRFFSYLTVEFKGASFECVQIYITLCCTDVLSFI